MPFVSPEKLLVILVIAVIVIGPEKLPQVAGQLGDLWHTVRMWRKRFEDEARGSFPEMPTLSTIREMTSSPWSYLDRLASAGRDQNAPATESTPLEVQHGPNTGAPAPAAPRPVTVSERPTPPM